MHLNREDIKNLLKDLKLVQETRNVSDYIGLEEQDTWRKEMIRSLENFQKMFGWEKD